jgi:long-chain-fatty-acid--CoA ligase ACSBG
VDWAKSKGLANFQNQQNGGSHSAPWGFALASLLLGQIKQKIGLDRVKYACTAAAPIGDATLNFFGALDIPVYEIYGMSECTGPHTASNRGSHLVGSTGPSLCGLETKIMHDASRDKKGEGEICYRGRHVMLGYMTDAEKTKEAIDADGWLHSGDVGRLDDDGMLYITGRIKELLITAGGENIPPVPIEDAIKAAAPAISNVMVIGDKKKYLTALVTLKTTPKEDGSFSDELTAEALNVASGITTVSDAIESEEFKAHVQAGLDAYNKNAISNAAKVQYFQILPSDFSVPTGELGPTLKLRRSKVVEKYSNVIDSMYKK